MKAIMIKPILFKEGKFVYPLFQTSNIKNIKFGKKSLSESRVDKKLKKNTKEIE